MNKVFIVALVAALAPALSGVAAADDTERINPQMQSVQFGDPAAGGAIASQREWEYLAALQKCEVLVDAEKTRCVDAAQTKYGLM